MYPDFQCENENMICTLDRIPRCKCAFGYGYHSGRFESLISKFRVVLKT
jgi:hypothetical protein